MRSSPDNLPEGVSVIDPTVAIATIEEAGTMEFQAHTHTDGEFEAHFISREDPNGFQFALNADGTWWAYGKKGGSR